MWVSFCCSNRRDIEYPLYGSVNLTELLSHLFLTIHRWKRNPRTPMYCASILMFIYIWGLKFCVCNVGICFPSLAKVSSYEAYGPVFGWLGYLWGRGLIFTNAVDDSNSYMIPILLRLWKYTLHRYLLWTNSNGYLQSVFLGLFFLQSTEKLLVIGCATYEDLSGHKTALWKSSICSYFQHM
jgi:hypothetical protein